MQGRILSFFNRAVSAVSSWSGGRPTEPAHWFGDPLASLSVDRIRRTFRDNLNRGEYAWPCFTFHEAARVCPIIVDKVSFWTASVSGLDWSIHQTGFDKKDEAERARAKKQADCLRAAYDRMDVKAALRHLALAKFYGFSVLVKKGYELEPLDWWNLLRDGRYGDWYWNGDLKKSSAFKQPSDLPKLPLDQMILREVEDNLLLVSLAMFYEYDKLNGWWNLNLEQESKRQVVILAGNGILDKEAFKQAAADMSDGKPGWLEKGGYSGGPTTEVIFPPASRGLGNFDIRAKVLDETLTKALTGGVLSMLTSPGSGTLAGSAHTETLHTIIGAEAAAISAILQDQYDRPILEDAGLLEPDERPLAWFELTNRRIIDPGTIINWAAQLATARYRIDLDELSERTGMKLIEAPEQQTDPTGRAPMLPNSNGGLDDLLNFDPSQPRDENGQWTDGGLNLSEMETPDKWEGDLHAKTKSGRIVKVHGYSASGAYGDFPVFHVGSEGSSYADLGMIRDGRIVKRRTLNNRKSNLANSNDNHDDLGRFAEAPGRISAGDADKLLDAGFYEGDTDGEKVRFSKRLKDKLDKMPDGAQRKEHLPWAREAVRSGRKTDVVEKGEKRRVYAKIFSERGKEKGQLVIVDTTDGEAFNIYRNPPQTIRRKGYSNRKCDDPDSQPSVTVLQAIAADGGLQDWLYTTPSPNLVNRAAESIGVPESWLGPVCKLLNDIAEKAPEQITPEYVEATLAEIKNRLPELFGEMDIAGFADVLEEGMGASALEGVRDAIRKRAAV